LLCFSFVFFFLSMPGVDTFVCVFCLICVGCIQFCVCILFDMRREDILLCVSLV
jgi:hypothetical protein